MEIKMILMDMNTGDVFSELIGWNKSEASFRTSEEWERLAYHYHGAIKLDTPQSKGWENRRLYCVPVAKPFELAQYT